MKRVATIGFGKKGASRFVELLKTAGVSTVVDTRRKPDSPLSGYARKRDLPFFLESAQIRYEHHPELAPPESLLKRYREDRDWDAYVRDFESVLQDADAIATMHELARRPETVALLCSEPTPDRCHRRLVAERMSDLAGPLSIIHLT